jgi:hypothetical protein
MKINLQMHAKFWLIIIENNMVLTLYFTLSTEVFAGLDKDNPYLDKAPNYERNYKTGKYEIVNNFKMPFKIAMTIINYFTCGTI